MSITAELVQQLYTAGSLRNGNPGLCFSLTNRLEDALVTGLHAVRVDGRELAPGGVEVRVAGGEARPADAISDASPLPFPLAQRLEVTARGETLAAGPHRVELRIECTPFGELTVSAEDTISGEADARERIPRDDADDFAPEVVQARRAFVEAHTGTQLLHAAANSYDPHLARGNCEHFVGVAQVPLGIAGPLRVNGEHARGEFLVPLATSEGTLVASYNRGMRVLN
ncbi:MAG TPA: hypothetical protein VFQ76_02565, partial [Longimicrobiaceae bacterium]|nr:hypothetical protein [Longimicrobiaceae bacterium]